jgi:DNA-binding transcriptional ArsR family regulator
MTRADNILERSRSSGIRRHDPPRAEHAAHAQRRGQRPRVDAEASPDGEMQTQRAADFFHLLAHPARLALLAALRDEAACVCHLEALLGYPQAYISQQLAVLRSAGVIEGRREGWNVFYHVCDARLFAVLDAALAVLSPADPTSPAQPTRRASGAIVPGCACPRCSTGAAGAAACDVRRTSMDGQEEH